MSRTRNWGGNGRHGVSTLSSSVGDSDTDRHIHRGVLLRSSRVRTGWFRCVLILPGTTSRRSTFSATDSDFTNPDRSRLKSKHVLREDEEDLDKIISLQLKLERFRRVGENECA